MFDVNEYENLFSPLDINQCANSSQFIRIDMYVFDVFLLLLRVFIEMSMLNNWCVCLFPFVLRIERIQLTRDALGFLPSTPIASVWQRTDKRHFIRYYCSFVINQRKLNVRLYRKKIHRGRGSLDIDDRLKICLSHEKSVTFVGDALRTLDAEFDVFVSLWRRSFSSREILTQWNEYGIEDIDDDNVVTRSAVVFILSVSYDITRKKREREQIIARPSMPSERRQRQWTSNSCRSNVRLTSFYFLFFEEEKNVDPDIFHRKCRFTSLERWSPWRRPSLARLEPIDTEFDGGKWTKDDRCSSPNDRRSTSIDGWAKDDGKELTW